MYLPALLPKVQGHSFFLPDDEHLASDLIQKVAIIHLNTPCCLMTTEIFQADKNPIVLDAALLQV